MEIGTKFKFKNDFYTVKKIIKSGYWFDKQYAGIEAFMNFSFFNKQIKSNQLRKYP